MKINTKIAIAVISIVLPALFITVYISSEAFNKIYMEEEYDDYVKTGQLVDNIVKLQGEKLNYLAKNIGNDATFLHSSLLASELGYIERPAEILSKYASDADISAYLYVDDATNKTISNILPNIDQGVLGETCTSGRMRLLRYGGSFVVSCSEVRYHGERIGRLLLGYRLEEYEKILSESLAKQVMISLKENEGIKKYGGNEYYVYKLAELFPGATGAISIRRGRIQTIYSKYRPYGLALLKYIFVFIAIIAVLHGVTWLLVTRRLRRIHDIIGGELSKKSLSLDDTKVSGDEIAETRGILVKLFRKLDEHEMNKERAVHLTAVGKMSATIAHDVRSPLSVLKAYFDVADKGEVDCECRDAAKRSVNKLLRMADDLVDIAKAGNVDREVQNVRMIMCKDVISEIKKRAAEREVRIRCEAEKDIFANVDGYKLERVLENMVSNAIEACEKGRGEVVIRIEAWGKDLLLEIADNGQGIAKDDLANIFNSFFTKEKKKGTGLGLSYCKRVIEAHGGTIDVESEVGRGTTFRIRIPDCIVYAKESKVLKNEPEISCDEKRFFIVDDDSDIRLRWRKIVQDGGGTVAHEASSLEDIESHESDIDYRNIDVAMVDYHYEGSKHTGADVIRYMRTKGVGEIHLCTGFYDDENVRAEAFSAGADSVIPKG